MSNYLETLVARHLDQTSLVRPRLASLYEPPANTAAIMHGQQDATPRDSDFPAEENRTIERNDRRPSVETPTGMRPPTVDSVFDEGPTTLWRGPQLAQLPPSLLTMPQVIQSNEPRAPISTHPASPKQPTSPPAPLSPQPIGPQLLAAPVLPPAAVLRDKDEKSPQAVRQHSNLRTQTVLLNDDQSESRQQIHDQTAQREIIADSLGASTSKGVTVQARVAGLIESKIGTNDSPSPRNQPGSSRLAQATATQAEPTINITIGRVEVRATLPLPGARQQRSAPQVTGLDEYLRQRATGNER